MDDIREYLLYGLAVEDPLLLEQEEKVEIQLGKQKVLMDKQLDIPNMSLVVILYTTSSDLEYRMATMNSNRK